MDELSPRNSFEVLPFSPSRQMSQRKLSYQEARPETGVPEEKIAPVSGRLTILPTPPRGIRNKILPSLTQLAQSRPYQGVPPRPPSLRPRLVVQLMHRWESLRVGTFHSNVLP